MSSVSQEALLDACLRDVADTIQGLKRKRKIRLFVRRGLAMCKAFDRAAISVIERNVLAFALGAFSFFILLCVVS